MPKILAFTPVENAADNVKNRLNSMGGEVSKWQLAKSKGF